MMNAPDRNRCKIDITSEMIKAGAERAWELRGFDPEYVVQQIWRATVEAHERARDRALGLTDEVERALPGSQIRGRAPPIVHRIARSVAFKRARAVQRTTERCAKRTNIRGTTWRSQSG